MQELLKHATTNQQRKAVLAYSNRGQISDVASSLGIHPSSARNLIKRVKSKLNKQEVSSEFETVQAEQTRDGFHLNVRSLNRIQTAAEAMEKAGIDAAIWEPTKVTSNSWEVAVRLPDKSIETKPLWQVKVECRRRVDESIEQSVDVLAKRLFRGKLKTRPTTYGKKKDPSTAFIGLVDQHFGKLCWSPETRNSYDLNVSEVMFEAGINHSLNKWKSEEVSKIVLPIGNDFCHIDTRAGTTEAGTPQDVDGRYEKVTGIMEAAVMRAVERARQIAPVEVVWVGGNHDPVTSMWLCRCVHWAYEKDDNVQVDSSPCPVKYRHFGNCLIGLAHGDAPKEKALKDLMPIEMADEWAASKACREWLTGHLHQQKKTERLGTHEEAGQVFRILPSLCGTDSWHYRNGFSMSRKATQSYLYSNEFGLSDVSHYPVERLYAEYASAL